MSLKDAIITKIQKNKYHLIAKPLGGGKFEVSHVRGALADHLKVGDHINSSDLDDFQNEGHKVLER